MKDMVKGLMGKWVNKKILFPIRIPKIFLNLRGNVEGCGAAMWYWYIACCWRGCCGSAWPVAGGGWKGGGWPIVAAAAAAAWLGGSIAGG